MKYFFTNETSKNPAKLNVESQELYKTESEALKEGKRTWEHLTSGEQKKYKVEVGYQDLPDKKSDLSEYQLSLVDSEDLPEDLNEWEDTDILGVIVEYDLIKTFE